ncbi:MAG: type II toxin-antitoxin system RelE/ParE family toxin [Bacteroidota bacterium]
MPGSKSYTLEYLEVVVREDILRLPKTVKLRIKRAVEERLTTNPVGFGQPLRYSLQGYRRLRVGDYRIVYCINIRIHKVQIAAIKHRKDIYS